MDLAFLFGMLLLTGALGGLSSGLFGVGGGFVVVPSLLMSLPVATTLMASSLSL